MLNKRYLDNALKFASATARGHCESALAWERRQQRGEERAGRFEHPSAGEKRIPNSGSGRSGLDDPAGAGGGELQVAQ